MSPFIPAAIFATALFAVSAGGHSAARPIGPQCDNEPTQAATLGCYTKIAKQLRSEVESAFRLRLTEAAIADADARKADIDGRPLADGVRRAQAAWEKYVDAECGVEAQTSFGGSGDDILRMACRDRLGRQRLADLNVTRRLIKR